MERERGKSRERVGRKLGLGEERVRRREVERGELERVGRKWGDRRKRMERE